MKNLILPFLFLALTHSYYAQHTDSISNALEEILIFQKELNEHYSDSGTTPLSRGDLAVFTGHHFFPVNLKYRVLARLELTPHSQPFEMPTTTTRKPLYRQYGVAVFFIDSVELRLSLFQSVSLKEKDEYKDYLFLPFKDFTNGTETYGGGRYIDLKKPENNKLIIDFNQSYNPYCAYSDRYSCPIPPDENALPLRIEAGIMHETN